MIQNSELKVILNDITCCCILLISLLFSSFKCHQNPAFVLKSSYLCALEVAKYVNITRAPIPHLNVTCHFTISLFSVLFDYDYQSINYEY